MANIWILKFRLCLKFKFKEVYLKAFWWKKSWEKKIIYEIQILTRRKFAWFHIFNDISVFYTNIFFSLSQLNYR